MLKRGAPGLAVAIAILPWLLGSSASAQTTEPADAKELIEAIRAAQEGRALTATAMADAIKAIQDANTLTAASKAFADGGLVDRNDADLNRAYLQRVIQLDHPEAAVYAANNLVATGSADGFTYWAMAYSSGRKGEYAKAVTWATKAAPKLADSNEFLYQLGQIAAWCDGTKLRLPDADSKALAEVRRTVSSKPAYQEGFLRIQDAFDKLAAAEDLKNQVATAENAVRDEEEAFQRARAVLGDVNLMNSANVALPLAIDKLQNTPESDDEEEARTEQRHLETRETRLAGLTAKIEAARATVQGHADAAATLTKDLAKLKAEADKSKPVSIANSFRWTISFASAPAQTQPARTQPARPH